HIFSCEKCGKTLKVPHSCKSRFCSSCGKKATDNWIKNKFNTLPQTVWQHITFTMDGKLWDFFRVNRYLLNKIPRIAANIIRDLAKQQRFLPGTFLSLHTFGRDLKWNVHLHLSTTIGGLSLLNSNTWKKGAYFYHNTLKKMWKYSIITLFRKEFKAGRLKMPPALKHITTYKAFYSWTVHLYNKTWVVHLNKQSDNMKANVEYLGKYLKRPPIGETRIKAYDGKFVTYHYLDHYTKTNMIMKLPVLEFIARLIVHIPDKNFRSIRYYGFLANRVVGKLLPIVHQLLKMKNIVKTKVCTTWRDMIKKTFNYDPIQCPVCNTIMKLSNIIFSSNTPIIYKHKEIANGYFPLL
ncbi:MAG: IS91 family transposase, partial [bacterium]